MKTRLRVKEIAEARGFNQSSLARAADLHFNTVKRIYQDPSRDISLSVLVAIADALNVTLDELVERLPEE